MANHCSMVRDSALCVLHLSLKHLRVDKALLPGIGQIPKDTMIISPKNISSKPPFHFPSVQSLVKVILCIPQV